MNDKKYLIEYEGFDKIFISEEEFNILKQMDCKNLIVYEIIDITFKKSFDKIKNGYKIFLCKNDKATEKKLKDVHPIYLDVISYDNDYILYSFIVAENEEEAMTIFNMKLKLLKLDSDDILNIDDCIDSPLNKSYSYDIVEISDKHPERTKEEKIRSEQMLKSLSGFFQ